MALLDSEVARLKFELGWNLLSTANPYLGTAAVFEQVIQPYIEGGAATTSGTTIVGDGTPKSITLTSATDFTTGDRIVVDVDARQETLTLQALSGATATALFALTHSGTYPVTVEGPETLIRQTLQSIWSVRSVRAKAKGRGALKAYVGEIEYYDTGKSAFASANAEINMLRDELAAACGDISLNLWRRLQAAGSRMSVY